MSDLLSLTGLLRLARDTIVNPREGAETVLSLAPPREALVYMFALVVVLSIILGDIVVLLTGPVEGPLMGGSPLGFGLIQAALLFIMMHAVHRIGQWFGGTGAFEEAALLIIWLQFIFVVIQVVQVLALLLVPPLAGLITVLALGLFFWLLVNFVAVLHGFTSLSTVFIMTIVSGIALLFVLTFILAIFGFAPEPGAPL